jgi:glutamate/tyrosine decarboxylase-like PLP-dependent enzyme
MDCQTTAVAGRAAWSRPWFPRQVIEKTLSSGQRSVFSALRAEANEAGRDARCTAGLRDDAPFQAVIDPVARHYAAGAD